MIRIVFKDEHVVRWKKKDYTDYKYDGGCFIIINKKQYVGIYNMDCIACITVR